MKRSSCAALVFTIMIASTPASPSTGESFWIPFDGQDEGTAPTVVVESGDESPIRVRLELHGMSGPIEPVDSLGGPKTPGVFSRIRIPEAGRTQHVGSPDLPVIRRMLQVPLGADLSVRVADLRTGEATLAELGLEGLIAPVRPPVPKVPGARVPFAIDRDAYASDRYLPEAWVTLGEEARIRGRRVVHLELHPVRYNPGRATLRYLTEIVVEIDLRGADRAATEATLARTFSPTFDRVLSRRILNSRDFAAGRPAGRSAAAEGLLVIVADAHEPSLGDLTAWQESKGYDVEVIPTSLAGDEPAAIKETIQTAYDTWTDPPLTHVILAGDTDTIPTFYDKEEHPTDLDYARLAGTDHIPDVILARLPIRSAAGAAEMASRFIAYEKGGYDDDRWIKKATFIATTDEEYYPVSEGTHDYCVATYTDPYGYSADKLYAVTFDADTSDVFVAVDQGRSLVVYSGHGNTTSWLGPAFTQWNVENLALGERMPFVCSHACDTNTIDVETCYGETWIEEGAIGFWGASDSTYWEEDDVLQKGMFEGVFDQDIHTLGGMVLNALLNLYDHYGGWGWSVYYLEIYHLLGDPTVSLWTEAPGVLDVDFAEAVPAGAGNIEITVTGGVGPVEGARVSLTKRDDGLREVGLTGPEGVVSFALDPAPASLGEIAVVVTASNRIPFEGTILVTPAEGPFLVHESHTVDDGGGDGAPNPGETVGLAVTLLNVGTGDGANIHAELSTDSPHVTILEGAAVFEGMASWAAGSSLAPHFALTSDPASPDGTAALCRLDWTADGGHAGTADFVLEICHDADGDGYASCLGDCDDADPAVSPDGIETCDGIDNDCDGPVDEGFDDADGDGFPFCTDCDESDPEIYPGAYELCDGLDGDCDGVPGPDEADADGDGYMACAGDCDDGDREVHPGHDEVGGNGIDDDCDGLVDETDICFIAAGLGRISGAGSGAICSRRGTP